MISGSLNFIAFTATQKFRDTLLKARLDIQDSAATKRRRLGAWVLRVLQNPIQERDSTHVPDSYNPSSAHYEYYCDCAHHYKYRHHHSRVDKHGLTCGYTSLLEFNNNCCHHHPSSYHCYQSCDHVSCFCLIRMLQLVIVSM